MFKIKTKLVFFFRHSSILQREKENTAMGGGCYLYTVYMYNVLCLKSWTYSWIVLEMLKSTMYHVKL